MYESWKATAEIEITTKEAVLTEVGRCLNFYMNVIFQIEYLGHDQVVPIITRFELTQFTSGTIFCMNITFDGWNQRVESESQSLALVT